MATKFEISSVQKQNMAASIFLADQFIVNNELALVGLNALISTKPDRELPTAELKSERAQVISTLQTEIDALPSLIAKLRTCNEALKITAQESESEGLSLNRFSSLSSQITSGIEANGDATREVKLAVQAAQTKFTSFVERVQIEEGKPLVGRCSYRECTSTTSAEKLRRCARCKIALYCSQVHQIAHWKFHKYVCKAPRKQ